MRFMIIIQATTESEQGCMPTAALMTAMARYHEELARAGVLLDASGLQPSAKGWRVGYSASGTRTVTDGPFTETKELIAGYTLIQVRSRDEALFRRAVDIALGARAGEQAAAALKQWRQTLPQSRQAAEIETQMLVALGRQTEARRALEAFIELTPEPARPAAISSLPRLVLGGEQPQATARMLEETLAPWRQRAATAASALNATAAGWLTAGDRSRSLEFVTKAVQRDPADPGAALLAVELMKDQPQAEALVRAHLASAAPAAGVRAAYVRRLSTDQRYGEALGESRRLTRETPDDAGAWLLQGALELESGEPRAARDALLRHLQITEAATPAAPADAADAAEDSDEDLPDPIAQAARRNRVQERAQAHLMLAQASEQLRDYAGAQAWLERLADQDSVTVLTRRASLLMRQGRIAEARAQLASAQASTRQSKLDEQDTVVYSTLAGRVGIVEMLGLSHSEVAGTPSEPYLPSADYFMRRVDMRRRHILNNVATSLASGGILYGCRR